jgi:hypothetical protein
MKSIIVQKSLMKHLSASRHLPALAATSMLAAWLPLGALATPTYTVQKVLVAEDEWQGENGKVDPKPIFKPHETDASLLPGYWISSNERGEEVAGEPVASKAGITILANGSNAVLATLFIEDACLPVVNPDGSDYGCAPPGAEGHPRHPHGIDIDAARKVAWQVIEHSGLKWNATRTGFEPALTTDVESGLLLSYDVSNPKNPKILKAYLLGHAAEESAVNEVNGKVYVGNHEPSALGDPDNGGSKACFVSVIKPGAASPYAFIDLPPNDCVQGIEVNETLQRVYGTTHVGEKMYAFKSGDDSVDYAVNIRAAFDAFVANLPEAERFEIPPGYVLHMHDLTTSPLLPRVYQTIHTIAVPGSIVEEGEEAAVAEADEITGRWVAEVNVNPVSATFKQVRIIDLSNGQSVPAVRGHTDNPEADFAKRFVHAHFLAVDPVRQALLVSGEHTGNLGVVDIGSRKLKQAIAISRPIPGCVVPPPEDPNAPPSQPEPHVHGVNIQTLTGAVYVSDEGENCFYQSVTILRP